MTSPTAPSSSTGTISIADVPGAQQARQRRIDGADADDREVDPGCQGEGLGNRTLTQQRLRNHLRFDQERREM